MTAIEKKSLEHIKGILDSFSSYKIYRELDGILQEYKSDYIPVILKKYEEAAYKENQKINETLSWVKILLIENK